MNPLFTCIITASTPRQAGEFRALLKNRLDHGLYPREIDFKVYSDPQQGRVGSGGGTLMSLMALLEEEGIANAVDYFADHRVLIIHAGGESRRMPCYLPEGKIFAPLPITTSSIIPPVVLDMQLTLFLKYPWRQGEVVVTSGDVVIDFDTALVPEDRGDVCGFAKSASLEQGSRHGVFKFDVHRSRVVDFYQKATVEELGKNARLEGTNECALDMGIVALSPAAAAAFIDLSRNPAGGGQTFGGRVKKGTLNFDLYLEVLIAGLQHLSEAQFRARIAARSKLDAPSQKLIFDIFHRFPLTGAITSATSFLHFGAVAEFRRECLELYNRGLKPFYALEQGEVAAACSPEIILFNSRDCGVPSRCSSGIVAEACEGISVLGAAGNNLFFGLSAWSSASAIPEGICLDERQRNAHPIIMVYHIGDTFRPQARLEDVVFCGMRMDRWLAGHGLTKEDIWDGADFDLLSARIYCAETASAFIAGYWQENCDPSWTGAFKASQRHSMRAINDNDPVLAREQRRIGIRKRILGDFLAQGIGWRSISKADFAAATENSGLKPRLEAVLASTDDELLKAYRAELMGVFPGAKSAPAAQLTFAIDYLRESAARAPLSVGIKEDQIVWARCPIRLDLAGGWSDTPPYTLRHGGQVVNIAADLNGQAPIQVFCRKTQERFIKMHSIDLGVSETIAEFGALAAYRDPNSPFGLVKAALCLLGLTEEINPGRSLADYCKALGCGLEVTLLCAVPKGSGLGTSSVLAATILAALQRFFGAPVPSETLFLQVLQVEQMLTTGGGWQDQIGGGVGGVKYIESKAGLKPRPTIHQLDPYLFLNPQTHACFTLFYTGITRLAKNILQEVVAQVNANTPAYFYTLHHIRRLAMRAREAFGLRSLAMVADIIGQSWEANKRIHASSSNEEIEKILAATKPLYAGVKLLGAGGGGYILFTSPTVASAEQLRNLLRKSFENEKARVVEFSLNLIGLEVTVS
ncbi:MAG: L-fucokinase [Chitinivibrionales bacterium]|nr:L-fucokinase [Chitinivibrionales bacterium]